MPTVTVNMPNGKKFRFDVPEGTTKEAALALAKTMLKRPQLKAPPKTLASRMGLGATNALQGIGLSDRRVNRIARGVEDALTFLTPVGNIDDYRSADTDLERQLAILPIPGIVKRPISKGAQKAAKELSTMLGSPVGKGSPAKVRKVSEDYLRQAEQGKEGADWYEKSGRSIMEHMGENEPAAVKLTGGIGVTSSQTPVLSNLEHAVRGHHQVMNGVPVKTGMFPTAMGADVEKVYAAPDMSIQQLREVGDASPYGKKRTPFIQQNLMYEGADTSTARSVHDIWDMRARQYKGAGGKPFSRAASPTEHRWTDKQDQEYLIPEANARQIGEREDWDTGRLQASAWVGNKIEALMAKGKSFEEAQQEAVTDYSNGWDRLYANHSWESAPGSNTGHMQGFDDLPWEERSRYHEDALRAFQTDDGRSKIALGYGYPAGRSYNTTGLYEGVMSPGTQDMIPVARATGSQSIDPASETSMNAIAATQGLLGAQKGAAWNALSPAKAPLSRATGFDFDLGRTISPEDIERYGPMIQAAFPAGNVGLLPSPTGMRINQFWAEDGDDLKSFIQELRRSNPELKDVRATTASGNYMENAWDAPEGRFGGQYVETLQGLNIPDIGKKFDSFAPQIAERLVTDIDPRMMRDAGLTGSSDIELLRKTIANEGWDGLVRLVDSQKGSVGSKQALLGAIAGLTGVGLTSDD